MILFDGSFKKFLFFTSNTKMPFAAFDLQGTLCTFEKVIETISKTLFQQEHHDLAKPFFTLWYAFGLRDYIATSQAGKYVPLIKILEYTLPRALICFDQAIMELTDLQVESIMISFDYIEPDSQAILALDLLVSKKWDVWVLSVGGLESTQAVLRQNSLSKYVGGRILCCDDLKLSKPHPKVYSELMRLAVHETQRIEAFYLIGSHAFELASAKNISLKTVFLNTTEKIYPVQMYSTGEPDVIGTSLLDCVEKMIEFENLRK
ncbi:HAD-like domain-containing protein [Helicostylum pulchrum]|nr:HAD-like domain-containing protein [Helicostylum pulchrum]